MPTPQVDLEKIQEIVEMFIEAGMHMDAVNVDGVTAASICTTSEFEAILMPSFL